MNGRWRPARRYSPSAGPAWGWGPRGGGSARPATGRGPDSGAAPPARGAPPPTCPRRARPHGGSAGGEARRADVRSLREAERELAEGLREATAVLARLDVAGAGPEAMRALEVYRRRSHRSLLAPGYPARAVRVLESAQRISAIL